MACYHPMLAGRMPGRTQTGKSPMKFLGKARSWSGRRAPLGAMMLPCRQCIGCRLERSRQWATRLILERKFHEKACFLTLTYDDKHIPNNGSLNPSHLTSFFKALRARNSYYGKKKIKYFACGEYGDKSQRPHYHVALFGQCDVAGDDADRVEEEPSRSGERQYSHSDFTAVWKHGRHRFSELSFESAAYIARYILKKVAGDSKAAHDPNRRCFCVSCVDEHYRGRVKEFQRGSNGLAKAHFDSWCGDIYPSDRTVIPMRGSFLPPPYFDRCLEKRDPRLYEYVKAARQEAHKDLTSDEWFKGVERSLREEEVKTLVAKATLIRGGV